MTKTELPFRSRSKETERVKRSVCRGQCPKWDRSCSCSGAPRSKRPGLITVSFDADRTETPYGRTRSLVRAPEAKVTGKEFFGTPGRRLAPREGISAPIRAHARGRHKDKNRRGTGRGRRPWRGYAMARSQHRQPKFPRRSERATMQGQGDQDQAWYMALSAAWWPLDGAEDGRGQDKDQ